MAQQIYREYIQPRQLFYTNENIQDVYIFYIPKNSFLVLSVNDKFTKHLQQPKMTTMEQFALAGFTSMFTRQSGLINKQHILFIKNWFLLNHGLPLFRKVGGSDSINCHWVGVVNVRMGFLKILGPQCKTLRTFDKPISYK